MRRSRLIPASAFLLGACHLPPIGAPSLSPRPEEARPILPPEAQPVEPAGTIDPALPARIATVTAQADEGHRAFLRQQAETDRLAVRAAREPKGGEAWLAAQQALSALGAAQAPVREAASALDAIRQEPANAALANRGAIDAASARVQALEDAEANAYAGLNKRLD